MKLFLVIALEVERARLAGVPVLYSPFAGPRADAHGTPRRPSPDRVPTLAV